MTKFPQIIFFLFTLTNSVQAASKSIFPVENREEDVPVHDPICKLPMDKGNSACLSASGNNSRMEIKWYFDKQTLECLAFKYNGCGGNANRFESIFDCKEVCRLPADYGSCAGRKPAATNARGEQIACAGPPHGLVEKCPTGYKCQMLAFYRICCEISNEEIYARNYRPSCANGKKPHQQMDTLNNWPVMHLGKSCSDDFCPRGSDCQQQEIFAHCCPK